MKFIRFSDISSFCENQIQNFASLKIKLLSDMIEKGRFQSFDALRRQQSTQREIKDLLVKQNNASTKYQKRKLNDLIKKKRKHSRRLLDIGEVTSIHSPYLPLTYDRIGALKEKAAEGNRLAAEYLEYILSKS